MQSAADVVLALEATTSRLDKELIIQTAWDNNIIEFFQGSLMALDSLRTYGVKKVPLIDGVDDANFVPTLTWQKFTELAHKLETRQLTGNTARDVLRAAADAASVYHWNGFYRRVLLKDLKCGVTQTTINKVLKKNGDDARKYIIPVFSCQLAEKGNDFPKKMSGPKFLDMKLDGCLSAQWEIEFDDGQKVSIAEVVDNKISGKIKSFNTLTGKIEFNTITNWAKNAKDINDDTIKWYRIILENGKLLPPLTGNHLVWLPNIKCWRRVDLLKVGDKLLVEEHIITFVTIKAIEEITEQFDRYDLEVENVSNFFANNVLVHNCRIISILDKNKITVTQYSRDGHLTENFPHIASQLAKLLPTITTSMVFDGEMVSRSFQALMTQLNRKDDVDTTDAKLALFDCLPLDDFQAGECTLTQTQRHAALVEFQPLLTEISNGSIFVVPKLWVNLDTAEGQTTFAEFNRDTVAAGYEGIMIKDPAASYKTKRTDAWLKIKPFITVDLELIDVVAGTPGSKYENTMGACVFAGVDNGKNIQTSVGSGYSDELRMAIWQNRDTLKGRIGEIKCDALTLNQASDNLYSMRFPVFMRFRGWEPGEKI